MSLWRDYNERHLHEEGREAYVSIQRRAENINAMSRLTQTESKYYITLKGIADTGAVRNGSPGRREYDRGRA